MGGRGVGRKISKTEDKQTRKKCAVPSLFLTERGNARGYSSQRRQVVVAETIVLPVVKSNSHKLRRS